MPDAAEQREFIDRLLGIQVTGGGDHTRQRRADEPGASAEVVARCRPDPHPWSGDPADPTFQWTVLRPAQALPTGWDSASQTLRYTLLADDGDALIL